MSTHSRLHCRAPIGHVVDRTKVPIETEIGDGRAEVLSWTDAGFELREMPTAMTDWHDPEAVVGTYHPEIDEFVTAEVGCDAVVYYPAMVRSPRAEATHRDFAPIESAHSDYTEAYGPMLATAGHPYVDILAPSMQAAGVAPSDLADARRILTLQLWRNIGPRRPDRPLALCDARTVDRRDLTTMLVPFYAGRPTEFETFLLQPPAPGRSRRWLTFPQLSPDEIVLFRTYDSDRVASEAPFWTPHTAFVDPTAGPDAPPRESVEIRAICLFW